MEAKSFTLCPPPLPQSGQVNVKFLDKLPYLGLFCRFIWDNNWSTFSQIEAVRLGVDPPPPQSGQPDHFFPVLLVDAFPYFTRKVVAHAPGLVRHINMLRIIVVWASLKILVMRTNIFSKIIKFLSKGVLSTIQNHY